MGDLELEQAKAVLAGLGGFAPWDRVWVTFDDNEDYYPAFIGEERRGEYYQIWEQGRPVSATIGQMILIGYIHEDRIRPRT